MKLLYNLIAATLELFRTTVNNLEKKNIELRNDLIDTRTNLNKKLEGIWNNLIVFFPYWKKIQKIKFQLKQFAFIENFKKLSNKYLTSQH